MMFSAVFKGAGLNFAQWSESRLIHAVTHGNHGKASEFAEVMEALGFKPQGYKRDQWLALFAGFTPTGGGRFNRATLPTFVAAVVALLQGNEGPALSFDKDEATAWDAAKPAPRVKAASTATPASGTPAPASGTPAPKARNYGAEALTEALDLLLSAASASVMLPEHWASVHALHALAPVSVPTEAANPEPAQQAA